MPLSTSCDKKTSTLTITFSGLVDVEERRASLSEVAALLDEHQYKFLLVDMTYLDPRNDPRDSIKVQEAILGIAAPLSKCRIAVVLAPENLTSSLNVLKLQQRGIAIMDFRSMTDATEWLYEETSV